MHIFLALPYYLSWHYTTAFSDMKNIWKNFFIFLYNFFGVGKLFKSFLSPWQRMQESYSSGFEGIVGTLIVNSLMRFVGIFIRFLFIFIWVVLSILCFILGVTAFFVWLTLPFLLILAILQGINLLTS